MQKLMGISLVLLSYACRTTYPNKTLEIICEPLIQFYELTYVPVIVEDSEVQWLSDSKLLVLQDDLCVEYNFKENMVHD